MSSKKKPRPLFEVPADIESGRESGWVYRSSGQAEHSKRAHAEKSREEGARVEASASVMDTGTAAFFIGFAAIAQAVALGLTIAVFPLTMGLRAFRSFRSD
ncbi:MAG TPA: hypothetical protein VFB63_20585 [Bryobacteraceae bacterium]|nr:hypothetical protein [Bryobacteraceae bacterium]